MEETTKKLEPIKNRKQRRFEDKLKRNKKLRKYYGVSHWVRRFIGEMRENSSVMDKVTSGKLDKYLG